MTDYSKVTISISEKLGLIGNMATMLTAGIPILEIVNSLLEDAKGGQKEILTALRDDITQGRQLSVAFAKFPRVFDKVTVNVVKASEEAGTLETTLKDLKENIRKQQEFNDKVRSSFLYPGFIGITFIGVLLLNLLFVIPKIAIVFKNLRVTLPLPTRILILMSDIITKNTVWFLLGLAIFVVSTYILFRVKRNFILGIIYSLPIISGMVKLIDLTQFSRSLYLLLYSGLPITEALELTEDVVSVRKMSKVIEKCQETILSGKKLSEGLRLTKGYIPPIMIKLVEAGEKTGTLDKSMQDISEYFDYDVTNSLKNVTTLIEPVMLVFVGIVVGGMMLAIIAPIYGLISQVGAMR
jgi:type II secretory pathway component PulF